MVNYLKQLENPQINYEKWFEVMRDFRRGGLNPSNYGDVLQTIKNLPPISKRTMTDYEVFDKYNLVDITEEDFGVINKEVIRRGIAASKFCWHPEASKTTCSLNPDGTINVSAAHSLQNNGVLSKIAEDGFVTGLTLNNGEHDGKEMSKKHASIFWGFCNTHDAIFRPIEVNPYTGTDEQHFLFAYRGFVVSAHKKVEVSTWTNFGEQSKIDIEENKKIFDKAILARDYSIVETETFELPAFYPVAVSTAFYLDFDFERNPIGHSDDRIEFIFVSLIPLVNKTLFLLSYLKQDNKLYGKLGEQLRKRNNLKSDITMLIAAHTENVYFNPTYYRTFIEQQEKTWGQIMLTQFDYATIDESDQLNVEFSLTPSDYLNNPYGINFFGY